MAERFYVNLPLTQGPVMLDGAEAHHLATVCRLRQGSEVCLFNGDGHEYPARITQVARREVTLEVLGAMNPDRELGFTLEVAAPLPKGDRGQFLVEKLTELGVTRFVPLVCQYSNTHPREAKRDKLERHVIEASKQCGRNVLMTTDDLTPWDAYAKRGGANELKLLAHPTASRECTASRERKRPEAPTTMRLAVGPEGGFTDAEVAQALEHGWQAISLGPRILRIETAAIVMAALSQPLDSV
jgi:16S rRNA (uracil1498-N3)-methyltransferase